MNQSASTINPANLQEMLDSATNAAELGQQQYYTPANLCAALRSALPGIHCELLADLHFGSGNIARAIPETTALGLDIDARTETLHAPKGSKWHLTRADLTHWYPIAKEADLRLPFIAINPPFSLKWHTERLSQLSESSAPNVAECFNSQGKTIDSTLASFLISIDLLSQNGEGFMVCNASTARRFFGDPTDPSSPASHPALARNIWQWLEIPGAIFEGTTTAFDTAVLYLRRVAEYETPSPISFLRAPSSDPATIARILTASAAAPRLRRLTDSHLLSKREIMEKWEAIGTEYGTRHNGTPPEYNISLSSSGRIRTYLTPFQHLSGKIPRDLIASLHALEGHTPIGLCVTATHRTALRAAAQSGIWNVQPRLLSEIENALAAYDREGAPFYEPSQVQSLGWVDEHSHLVCSAPGIGTAKPGDKCPISCSIEDIEWKGTKTNFNGELETLTFKGKELLVSLTDPSGHIHHFHVRREDNAIPSSAHFSETHHHITSLLDHFHIPTPQDVASLHPEAYQANLAALTALEERINAA